MIRQGIRTLLLLVIALPLAHMILSWIKALLVAIHDQPGSEVLEGLTSTCQIGWLLSVVGLLIVMGVDTVLKTDLQDENLSAQDPVLKEEKE